MSDDERKSENLPTCAGRDGIPDTQIKHDGYEATWFLMFGDAFVPHYTDNIAYSGQPAAAT